ncbi:hypothetical protein BDV96DRAFT_363112 [Lophiotrema nucula]|uniref:F-box domain-containing protein n=1 Tax=Lophiotrema nucula TaxID=690887 RepID=A0A6A5ZJ22_9PLEO|nr:hypothetical protein BDV96DRAFT_363112 [Lophiotrema nucula]
MYSSFLPHLLKRLDNLLPRLNHIVLGDWEQDPAHRITYVNLDLIRPIFYASNIQRFEAKIFEPWRISWNCPVPPKALSLWSLHIFRTNISLNMLYQLLSATPSLKSLHYEQEHKSRDYRLSHGANLLHYTNLDGLDRVLSNIAHTLEELRLSVRVDDNLTCNISPSFGPAILGRKILKAMNRLRILKLPMLLLLSWPTDQLTSLEDILPASIEELILCDDLVARCPWEVGVITRPKMRLIGEYMEGRALITPELRCLTIRVREEREEDW